MVTLSSDVYAVHLVQLDKNLQVASIWACITRNKTCEFFWTLQNRGVSVCTSSVLSQYLSNFKRRYFSSDLHFSSDSAFLSCNESSIKFPTAMNLYQKLMLCRCIGPWINNSLERKLNVCWWITRGFWVIHEYDPSCRHFIVLSFERTSNVDSKELPSIMKLARSKASHQLGLREIIFNWWLQ